MNFKFYLQIRVFFWIIAFCMFVLAGFSSSAQACGWWGDAEHDDADMARVGADGKPIPDNEYTTDDPVEQTRIGDRFRRGASSKNDYVLAVYWYLKAAQQGFTGAQNNLANMYEQGLGVLKDESEAATWFKRAAEKGDRLAQHSLGSMYLDGRGVAKNSDEAVKWFQKAAEQGHYGAFRDLGEMYWNGHGVSKNDVLAFMWWELGAMHGDMESKKLQKMIIEKMIPGKISEAENMAKEWMLKKK